MAGCPEGMIPSPKGGCINSHKSKTSMHEGGHFHTIPNVIANHRHPYEMNETLRHSGPPLRFEGQGNYSPITRYQTDSQGISPYSSNRGQMRRKGGRTKPKKYPHGGMHGSCPPGQHMMPNGQCMQGAYHGAPMTENAVGQIEGKVYKKNRGGRAKPRRKFNSGGHMHNITMQQNLDGVSTSHNHRLEVPSQEGESYNQTYSALFHRHKEYDGAYDDGTPTEMTGRPIFNTYGNPSPHTHSGTLDDFPGHTWNTNSQTLSGQTTGEVGSVPGAGHVHRAGPNLSVRRKRGGRAKPRKFAEGATATAVPKVQPTSCTSLQELINQAYCCDNSTSITGQGPNPMTNCCTQFSSYYANYFGTSINWSNTMMPDVFNEMGMDAVMSGECPNLDINGQGECSYCTNPAVRSVIQDGQVSRGLSRRVRPRTSRLGVLNRENAMEARLPIERRQRRPMSAMKRGGQVRQKPLRGRGIKRRK